MGGRRSDLGMKLILQCLAVVVGAAAFVPLIRSNVWWIRGLDFPRMQFLAVGLFLALGLAAMGVEWRGPEGVVMVFLLLSFAFQVWHILPYSALARKQVLHGEGRARFSIFISNVLMENRQADRLLARIRERKPDVVVAVETDQWWTDRLRGLADSHPHTIEVPQENTYGMVIRSRFPLHESSVEFLVKETVPSIHTRVELPCGVRVQLHAMHPKPPYPEEDPTTTDRDAELLVVGKRVGERGGPTIVAGDLNDVAWSKTTRLFQKISRLLDPRIGRGRFNTYHAAYWWLRWPLDHVFHSDHFRLLRLEVQPSIGSDHFPIFAELSYEPAGEEDQSPPPSDREAQQEADAKIEEAGREDR
jgi:endonuclease/exonuclease/phosphatase (EEP) superfamily protein YafD